MRLDLWIRHKFIDRQAESIQLSSYAKAIYITVLNLYLLSNKLTNIYIYIYMRQMRACKFMDTQTIYRPPTAEHTESIQLSIYVKTIYEANTQ